MTHKQRATITKLLNEIREESFIESYKAQATDEELMGLLVSKFFEWDSRIIKVAMYAFEDANFHSEAALLAPELEKLEALFNKEAEDQLAEDNRSYNAGLGV